MTEVRPKICPNCRERDITEFSLCRFCGTRYDAPNRRQNPIFDERVMAGVLGILLLIGGIFYYGQVHKSIKTERYASITNSIQAANKPRLIEFYATWCGACKMYEPVLANCQANYSGKIDFQRVNVDDPNNKELTRIFEVTSYPRTFLFNRKGEQVAEIRGWLKYDELDEYLQDPELFK